MDLSAFGQHRVIEPKGTLPQSALRLNNSPTVENPNELLLDVEELMLDATSMRQVRESCAGVEARMASRVLEIVRERGKMHNPVTNSGGVLIGRIREVGAGFFSVHRPLPEASKIGQTVVPVASLSTLPLHLSGVKGFAGDRVLVEGKAVMFSCMKLCPVMPDLGAELTLACVDISSLVPQVNRCLQALKPRANEPLRILVMGCGKAGLAALYCARDFAAQTGARVQLLAIDYSWNAVSNVEKLKLADAAAQADARQASSLYEFVARNTNGSLCDLVINVVNVAGTETPTVLCTRPQGTVLWFSMATRFDQAALATDSLGRDVTMIIGNGVADGQVEQTVALARAHPEIFKTH